MATDPPPGDAGQAAEDEEAKALWARLAPFAEQSHRKVLDDYFAEVPDDGNDGKDGKNDGAGGGTGGAGPAAAGGPGGDARAAKPKVPAKAPGAGAGADIWEFLTGKRR